MEVTDRYRCIQEQVHQAATLAGRAPSEVALMVVSKTWGAEAIRPIVEIGHRVYGENRVLEASDKITLLPDGLEWHLIGHLQKNKVRKAVLLFHTIHSVDSIKLAAQIARIAQETDRNPRVFLQVNIGNEPQKHGFEPAALEAQLPEILALPHLEVAGLMAIPPKVDTPEEARPYFRALRELRDRLQDEHQVALPGLSMGMTSDFDIAIQEGATIVRVGSAIFGPRQSPPAP